MSDAHKEHQSGIRTPKQLIAAVIASFLIPIICIVLLVQYVTNATRVGAGSDSQTPEAIAARIKPVADEGFTLRDANAPKQLQAGPDVYKAVCAACHATGAAGAPKVGDASSWSARIAKGFDTLLTHALKGFNAMPAKGGNPDLDDVEVARAVVYMANESGAKFKEPEVKPNATATTTASSETSASTSTETTASTAPSAETPAAPVASAPAAASTPAAPAAASADAGKKLYDSVCMACHSAGVAGAPKFGDKMAWASRIQQGTPTLYEHALKGFQGKAGMMPPKGGSSASDADVKAAVDYMVAASK